MIGSVILAAIVWLIVIFFDRELLYFFGAQEGTLDLAREYVSPIKPAIPVFLFNQMLAAYLFWWWLGQTPCGLLCLLQRPLWQCMLCMKWLSIRDN